MQSIFEFDQNKYPEALADYAQAIEIDPKNRDVYFNRGCLYLKMEKFDLALKDLNEAITLDPKYATAYKVRSKVKMKLSDLNGARDDVLKFSELTNQE